MNYDELAFFNQQLAAMLQEGIPLEGALKQLSAGMRDAPLRAEMEALEKDLASGKPLSEALAQRRLPELYRRMLVVGVRGNDLPGMLTLLADHYHRTNALWTRLKGLMVYPLLVLVVSLSLTLILTLVFSRFLTSFFEQLHTPPLLLATMWVPPIVLAVLAALGLGAVLLPSWRQRLRWRLPAFKEASLAQLASALALMLRKGTTLPEALGLAEGLESGSPAREALVAWRVLVEKGQGNPAQWPQPMKPFPPLFLWLIQKGGEDLAAGFQNAADIYQDRAAHRIELALYGALPVSILFLGQMILWQVAPLVQGVAQMMNALGDSGM